VYKRPATKGLHPPRRGCSLSVYRHLYTLTPSNAKISVNVPVIYLSPEALAMVESPLSRASGGSGNGVSGSLLEISGEDLAVSEIVSNFAAVNI